LDKTQGWPSSDARGSVIARLTLNWVRGRRQRRLLTTPSHQVTPEPPTGEHLIFHGFEWFNLLAHLHTDIGEKHAEV
jgi:hypothetical protein